jgi:hypothetical protein
MAVFTRVNGGGKAAELFGRDLKYVKVSSSGLETSYTNPDSDYEKVIRVLERYSTVSVTGIPTSGNAVFVVEGLPTTVGDNSADQSGGTAIVTQLQTEANATCGSGAVTVVVYNNISGTSFA